ncbi:LacI family DNA-binding transcriptional regulator [Phycicoccus sp. HDW14]|uniref:LacI family DNA-binding transcriptional regulator n=1 Tax=Phycicoccus sp. HDW14 TaxID=2714941 RepID=UPI001F10825D|nr:LacI family DNA-binding transcriptional regulator [Phycicoccus sp. HDW14]
MARAAGVSVATVSRALRGLDRVSPETRQRVLDVAEELHYVASPTATSLASGRTRVVAVVAPFLTRWFFATLVSAIEKELRSHGHHAILFDLEDDSYDQRLPLTQGMLWKRVDGVITLNVPMGDEEIELVDRLGLPLVAIGSAVPGRPCVRIDDRATMRTAVEHLIDLGHERIGYIGDVPRNVAHVQTPRTA